VGERVKYIKFMFLFSCLIQGALVSGDTINTDTFGIKSDILKIEYVDNLSLEGKAAFRKNKVLLLYVSRPNCPYCEKLKVDVLIPLVRGKRFDDKIVIREISLDDNAIIGFDGKQGTANEILVSYDIVGTPTLLFLNRKGDELTEKLSGYFSKDFYWAYFEKAVRLAVSKLKDTDQKPLR